MTKPEWIKVRINTATSIDFMRLEEMLNRSTGETFFAIFTAAEWMLIHGKYGVIDDFGVAMDMRVGIEGFANALLKIGWAKRCERGLLFTPRFPCSQGYVRKMICTQTRRKFLAGKACAKCGSLERLEIDHIVPVQAGGSQSKENLQVLCKPCHKKKTAKEVRRRA